MNGWVRTLARSILVVSFASHTLFHDSCVHAQETLEFRATAPANHVELSDTNSGSHVIAKPLKDEYDALVAQLHVLRDQIESGQIGGAEAQQNVQNLREKLQQLRDQIESEKVFVPVATEHKVVETIDFELGPERLLVINSDSVHVIGWDKPFVRCQLEKIILSGEEAPSADEFDAIQLVHQHGKFPELIGRTAAEVEAEEQTYLQSEDGKALTDEQRAGRRELVDSIVAHFGIFADFQGKELDTIEVQGVRGQDGNRQITLELKTDGGESHRSVWRRHARLAVYVPQAHIVAIRGAQENIDIRNLKARLVITSQGSHNRDYDGRFEIHGVEGSVLVQDAPMNVVENVTGDVSLIATKDYANSGTQHDGGAHPSRLLRTHYYFPPLDCLCKNIGGNLNIWFNRVDLAIEGVSGKIDVRNEFGDSALTINTMLANDYHRVVSESGRVEVILSPEMLGELPLFAVTQCGTVRTNAPSELLDTLNMGTHDEGVMRSWSGFRRILPGEERHFFFAERFSTAIRGDAREPGLDLISRGGAVVVTTP